MTSSDGKEIEAFIARVEAMEDKDDLMEEVEYTKLVTMSIKQAMDREGVIEKKKLKDNTMCGLERSPTNQHQAEQGTQDIEGMKDFPSLGTPSVTKQGKEAGLGTKRLEILAPVGPRHLICGRIREDC